MRYITLNLLAFCMLIFTINLSAELEPEPEAKQEEDFKPDWDKTIRDIERDAEIHRSWDTWGAWQHLDI